jgi:ArsR family transcriptional regulator
MSVMQRAGLVESTRIGQWTYYRRNRARLAALPELLGQSL